MNQPASQDEMAGFFVQLYTFKVYIKFIIDI
jgi:hypothetical protein